MSVEIDTSSIDQALKRMVAQEKKVRNAGLKKAAQSVAQRLEENTPIENESDVEKHMKGDIAISGVDQNGEIFVGYGKDTFWRAHFVEMGTIKQKPQGFIQRTEEEMRNEVINIMAEEFKRGLGL
ncbi:HK97-gp10 family putative phage morphogenesis protein [Bacillus smithii]|jgi:HK97 gp10 family phage protein|uniref:HK97-gp10 family putative phage morphogenesis protein n=1 Tax=Bacillus smithii TaxID=1479 RepID=UPI003D19E460